MRQYSLYVTTRQIVVLEIKLYNASEHRLRHTLVADYGTALPLSRQDLHLQASKSLAGRDYQLPCARHQKVLHLDLFPRLHLLTAGKSQAT